MMKRRIFLGAAPALCWSPSVSESARGQARRQPATFDSSPLTLGLVELVHAYCNSNIFWDDVDRLLALSGPLVAGVGVSADRPALTSAAALAIDWAHRSCARFDKLQFLLVQVYAREDLSLEQLNDAMSLFDELLASGSETIVNVDFHKEHNRWAKLIFVGR